jgi:hypothetical protein
MISICIPVHNFNIQKLVDKLSGLGVKSGIPFEIIVIDDLSADDYRELNAGFCKQHKYIKLDRNIGRARIRNLFPGYSKYQKLLFLDCDSEIISDDFLDRYIIEIKKNESPVICGGRIYPKDKPPPDMRLRWKFGIERESFSAYVRGKSPFRYFMTNNFLIDRDVLMNIKFDERIVRYGYEDTLFAYRLMKNHIEIKHTDNQVIHFCMETNSDFIGKTEQSIVNLVNILDYINHDKDFIDNIRILRVYNRLERLYLTAILRFFFRIMRPPLRFLLERGLTRLWFFDFYKLGLLTVVNGKQKTPG